MYSVHLQLSLSMGICWKSGAKKCLRCLLVDVVLNSVNMEDVYYTIRIEHKRRKIVKIVDTYRVFRDVCINFRFIILYEGPRFNWIVSFFGDVNSKI